MFVWSLGLQIPADWVAKEVQLKGKLDYEPETFSIIEDHLILRFKIDKDSKEVLGLWRTSFLQWNDGSQTLSPTKDLFKKWWFG